MSELKEIRERAVADADIRTIVKENPDRIREAYELIMRLSQKARSEGVLALEYETGIIPKDMPLCREIGDMAELVVDGTDPALIAELMTLGFLSGNYNGLEALLYFLYARGILMIQAGENPYMVEAVFRAVIPKDLLSFDRRKRIGLDQKLKMVKEIKSFLSERENACLENISGSLSGLTEEEWKAAVRTADFYEIDKVIPYLDEKTIDLVKTHVNESRYFMILQSASAIKEEEIDQIREKLEQLIAKIRTKPEYEGGLSGILPRSAEEMQALIAELDVSTIALALKGEPGEISDCFYRNMPPRLKYEIQEEIAYMGPVRRCDAEEAQSRIRSAAEEKLGWEWLREERDGGDNDLQ